MTKYELMVLINPDIGGDATQKRLDQIRKLITSQKGEIFYEDLWGIRDLAYKIKTHESGYYSIFYFSLEGELNEIDTTCRLDNDIMRHMITKLPGSYEPKSFANMDEEEEEETKEAPKQKVEKKVTKKEEEKTVKSSEKKEPAKATEKKTVEKEKSATKEEKEESKEPSLEDVDAKLKSIIDNPDLNF